MITKKLDNKAALPKAEETKKAKGVVGKMEEDLSKSLSNPEPDPKKGKKGTPAPPPKKGKKEEEEAPPKKGKTAPPSKAAKTTPYREGSSFARAFQRLMAGKALTLEQMFEGVEAGDPSRMASHMIRRGDESKEFKIVRQNDGRLLMTKIFGK